MMAKKNKANKEKKKGGFKTIPALIVGLLLAFFLQGSFILLLVGMLPTVVAYYADTGRHRMVFRIIMACNLSGTFPFLCELVLRHNSTSLLLEYLTDPTVWLMMYLSAAIGYILVKGMPYLIEFFYDLSNATRIARLQSLQNRLVEEWGPEIQRAK